MLTLGLYDAYFSNPIIPSSPPLFRRQLGLDWILALKFYLTLARMSGLDKQVPQSPFCSRAL